MATTTTTTRAMPPTAAAIATSAAAAATRTTALVGRLLDEDDEHRSGGGCGSASSGRNPPDSVPPAAAARGKDFAPAATATATTRSHQEAAVSDHGSASSLGPNGSKPQPATADPALLRVLNFNVFAGSPLPFYQNYTSTQSLDDSRRLHLQIEKIRELEPDIVTLQEVCSDGVHRYGCGRGFALGGGRVRWPTQRIRGHAAHRSGLIHPSTPPTNPHNHSPTPTYIYARHYKEALGQLGYDSFSESQPPEALGLALLYLLYALMAGVLSFALHLSIDVLGLWSPASRSAAALWLMWWGQQEIGADISSSSGSSAGVVEPKGALVFLALFLKSLVLAVLVMRKTCLAGFLGGTVKASMVVFWRRGRVRPWRAADDGGGSAGQAGAAAKAGVTTLFSEQRGDWLNLFRPRGYLTARLSFRGLAVWVVNTHLNLVRACFLLGCA